MRSSTIPAPGSAPADAGRMAGGFCFAVVSPVGRLSVLDAPTGGLGLFPLGRRTVSGLVWRLDLGHGLVCWLDGDAHAHDGGGQVNLAGTAMSLDLLGERGWPLVEPYLCGPALFTGRDADHRPVGLSERQLWLVAEVHANAEAWAGGSLTGDDRRVLEGARR